MFSAFTTDEDLNFILALLDLSKIYWTILAKSIFLLQILYVMFITHYSISFSKRIPILVRFHSAPKCCASYMWTSLFCDICHCFMIGKMLVHIQKGRNYCEMGLVYWQKSDHKVQNLITECQQEGQGESLIKPRY